MVTHSPTPTPRHHNDPYSPYLHDAASVIHYFGSTTDGLSSQEAAKRLLEHGTNTLQEIGRQSVIIKYLLQFKDMMVVLLLISSVLSFFLGDQRTGTILLLLVIFNTAIGFFQEFRAERTMEALNRLVASYAEVYRDGKLQQIDGQTVVVGDIVRLTEGDAVPADIRLYKVVSFATNDFALTGESQPTRKFTHAISKELPTNVRHNIAFMGTTVATGEAFGVVTATGMTTELGRIANLSAAAPHAMSPLQIEVAHIARVVTYGVAVLCAALLIIAIKANLPFKDAFLFAIGIASSLIPQGLPAEINTSLAQAAGKLARARALVKKLSAVETLGATHVICTDKTGTLTKNEMTVESIIIGGEKHAVSGSGYEPTGAILRGVTKHTSDSATTQMDDIFFACGALASNAKILPPDDNHAAWYCLGDPTEGALVTLALKAGLDCGDWEARYEEVRELPFDSARKRMTSLRHETDDTVRAFVKGAPESIIERCTHILDGHRIRPITQHDKDVYLREHTERAARALRNLAYATRTMPHSAAMHDAMDTIESHLILLGMVSMSDPLRETVPAAMAAARDAHIQVNVITGDFAITAEAIARKAGLVKPDETITVIPSDQLQAMSDRDLMAALSSGHIVFSRVSPEDKMRIVSAIKQSSRVVAVTGDGINDAPALKHADIGVAMGVTGTDVAKQSSEIVLLDDSFATLVGAIQQGRIIFANIKKATLCCFTSNTSELVTNLASLAGASLFAVPLGINIMQLLSIDLLAELFPIAALGWDKGEGNVMKERPRDPHDHILNRAAVVDLLWCGLIIGGLAYGNYLWYLIRNGVDPSHLDTASTVYFAATTVTWLTIVCCQLLNIIQRRSINGFFSRYQLHNRTFWLAMAFSLTCVLLITYVPAVSDYMRTASLGYIDWLCIIGAALLFLGIRELQRIIRQSRHRTTHAAVSA